MTITAIIQTPEDYQVIGYSCKETFDARRYNQALAELYGGILKMEVMRKKSYETLYSGKYPDGKVNVIRR